MAMSTRNAKAAGASVVYDYTQASNQYYDNLMGIYGANAVPGLCGGTAISWLGYRRGLGAGSPPDRWVTDYRNDDTIRQHTIRIINAGNQWVGECADVVETLGFARTYNAQAYTFYDQNLPAWIGITGAPGSEYVSDSEANQFALLAAYGQGASSHALGLHLRNGTAAFFDPNEGYAFFPIRARFAAWFSNSYKAAALQTFFPVNGAMSCALLTFRKT